MKIILLCLLTLVHYSVVEKLSDGKPKESGHSITNMEVSAETNNMDSSEKDDDAVEPLSILIGKEEDPSDPFIATTEWQSIKPGQTIPRGLHVRMNLQTGEKEAKLLEKDENLSGGSAKSDAVMVSQEVEVDASVNDEVETGKMLILKKAIEDAIADLETEQEDGVKYWKDGDNEGMMNVNKKTFSKQELKDALKKFKAAKDDVKDEEIIKGSKENKFRDIDTLKKEFEELDLNVKTDYEIITELLTRYRSEDLPLEEHKEILTDLEYYLHQIDNAKDFSKMGGLSLVIKDLNHTDKAIRSEAAFVIGSATQSNPHVQVKAIESGALQQLIRMTATQTSVKVRNRVLYAIASTIRHFPYAQQRFIELGGFSALSTLFQQDANEKVKLKCITLITDLVLEQRYTNPEEEQKVAQYKKVPLIKTLQELGWCELITALLSSEEHDSREKVLVAMDSLMDTCRKSFTNSFTQLIKLKAEYEGLSKSELTENQEDHYYTGLLSSVDSVISDLKVKDEL